MSVPRLYRFDIYARRHFLKFAHRAWCNEGDGEVGDETVEMVDELAGVLTAPCVGFVPEVGVDCDMHREGIIPVFVSVRSV